MSPRAGSVTGNITGSDVASLVVGAVFKWREENAADWRRFHLGASLIGRECSRELWLLFRWAIAPNHDGRLLRLFARGDIEENRFVEELRGIGATVLEVDPDTGKQFRVTDHDDHFSGSCDGVCVKLPGDEGTWYLLEFKTSNDKQFGKLKIMGVQKTKPEHFAQMQVYMFKLGLTRALYMAANKNNDEIYTEVVELDEKFAQGMIDKAGRIIYSPGMPVGFSSPRVPPCGWCNMKGLCHPDAVEEPAVIESNCRTCRHSEPVEDGQWFCNFHFTELPRDQQLQGCDDHDLHADLAACCE